MEILLEILFSPLFELVVHLVAMAFTGLVESAKPLPAPEQEVTLSALREDTRTEGEILAANRRRAGWTPRRDGQTSGGFVILNAETVSAEARCPICAQAATGEVRGCPSCGVVLHRDCMNYNGSCGIYGCASSTTA